MIPSPFTFSQSSLQDYHDCPRRFQLRYIEQLAWPAVESEPTQEYEKHQQEGSLFHRMVQQHIIGVPAEKISQLAQSERLSRWWEAYLDFRSLKDFGSLDLYPEHTLSAPLGEHRIVAKFDLIAIKPGEKALIYDWKTYRKRPRDEHLATRWQTRLYPALLTQASARLNGGEKIRPEQIEMVYWFSNFPHEPASFKYSDAKFQRDWDLVEKTIEEINAAQTFPMVEDERPCRFCTFRSYCDRGKQAGDWEDFEAETEAEENFSLDFEQVGEIAF